MTFDEWASEYFGRDVDVPQACRDAWKAGQREALLDAAEQMESYCGPTVYYELHRMAKELE